MEVPLRAAELRSWLYQAELIDDPGANISTQSPQLENEERSSAWVVDATVNAGPTRLGDPLQASVSSLPAAITMVTPALIAP